MSWSGVPPDKPSRADSRFQLSRQVLSPSERGQPSVPGLPPTASPAAMRPGGSRSGRSPPECRSRGSRHGCCKNTIGRCAAKATLKSISSVGHHGPTQKAVRGPRGHVPSIRGLRIAVPIERKAAANLVVAASNPAGPRRLGLTGSPSAVYQEAGGVGQSWDGCAWPTALLGSHVEPAKHDVTPPVGHRQCFSSDSERHLSGALGRRAAGNPASTDPHRS